MIQPAPTAPRVQCEVERTPQAVTAYVRGEMRNGTCDDLLELLRGALASGGGAVFVLDLVGVTQMDSISIGNVITLRKAAERLHRPFLVRCDPVLIRFLQSMNLDRVLTLLTPEEALPATV